MKKSIKKYLIIAFVIMAVVLTTVFAVSAATTTVSYKCGKCGRPLSPVYSPAQCEADEREDYICTTSNCKNKDQVLYTVTYENTALGHEATVKNYTLKTDEQTGETYYTLTLSCVRKCGYKEVDEYEKDKPYKYYAVTFVNPCVTVKKLSTCVYDTVADTTLNGDIAGVYKEVELDTRYIRENSSVTIETAYRDDDKKFGGYVLAGWTTDKAYATPGAYESNIKAADFSTEVLVPIGTPQADYKVYAVFAPDKTLTHTVRFYDDTGFEFQEYKISVPHGENLSARDAKIYTPEKADGYGARYTFSHWIWKKDGKSEIKLSDAVYESINLDARFAEIPKEYKLKYFYKDGKTPVNFKVEKVIGTGESMVTLLGDIEDTVTVVADANGKKMNPVNGLALNALTYIPDNSANNDVYNNLFKYSERDYDYLFTGKWIVYGTGVTFDLENMAFNGALDSEQTGTEDGGVGYIKLVPQYKQVTRLYPIDVIVSFDDDGAPHPEEVYVQLTDANGEFKAGATYTSESTNNIVKDEKGKFLYYKDTFFVPYSSKYVVSASAKAYAGSKEPAFSGSGFPGAHIELVRGEAAECSCLCHSILKPIWVKILNLLNTLFGLKVVCCDDMYANIGHLLNYTPKN